LTNQFFQFEVNVLIGFARRVHVRTGFVVFFHDRVQVVDEIDSGQNLIVFSMDV
jgi:hypothetical protein